MTATQLPPAQSNRPRYKRVLLKLSGESFCQPGGHGIDSAELRVIAAEVAAARQAGAQVAVVVGGGNLIRGAQLALDGLVHRATADQMGMLGTVVNGLALREALTVTGHDARCMTAVEIKAVAEPFIRLRAIHHMEKGSIVILAGGTGNPFFTTDTAAALRATELECEAVLKATKVDGVYTADPKRHADAQRFAHLTFEEAIEKRLAVMDMTALTMCREQKLPVVVFDFKKPGNIRRVIEGERVGTLISPA